MDITAFFVSRSKTSFVSFVSLSPPPLFCLFSGTDFTSLGHINALVAIPYLGKRRAGEIYKTWTKPLLPSHKSVLNLSLCLCIFAFWNHCFSLLFFSFLFFSFLFFSWIYTPLTCLLMNAHDTCVWWVHMARFLMSAQTAHNTCIWWRLQCTSDEYAHVYRRSQVAFICRVVMYDAAHLRMMLMINAHAACACLRFERVTRAHASAGCKWRARQLSAHDACVSGVRMTRASDECA